MTKRNEKGRFETVRTEVKEKVKKNPNDDKLVIMGFSPTSQHHAIKFLNDYPGCEMWCMNEFYVFAQGGFPIDKASRWFDIHNCRDNPNVMPDHPQGKQHRETLKKFPGKLYVQNKAKWWNDFDNAIEFPAKEIIEFFPRKYFSSTPSWHFALAIMEGIQEYKKTGKFKWSKILVSGVDMQSGWVRKTDTDPITGKLETKDVVSNEYAMQRPSCEWLIGMIDMLKMLDIDCEIIIPEESTLLKYNRIYGFEEYFEQEDVMKMKKELETQLGFYNQSIDSINNQFKNIQYQLNTQIKELEMKLATMTGAKQAIELRLSTF